MKISQLRKMTKKQILDYLEYVSENFETFFEAEDDVRGEV